MVNVRYSNGTVDDEVALDNVLEVLGTWVSNGSLEVASSFGLFKLSLAEAFRLLFDGGDHR